MRFSNFLQQNGATEIGKHIRKCNIEFDDVGYAYYAGLRGGNWDKHAVDVTVIAQQEDILFLKNIKKFSKIKCKYSLDHTNQVF